MAVYSGVTRSITPATNDDNWTLRAGAAKGARIVAFHWGGEATSSAAMQTRVARSSGQTGSASAGNVEKLNPNSPANGCGFSTTFATTQPSLEAGDLFSESWNNHGGIVVWHAGAPDEEIYLLGATVELCISCRNTVGTGVSTYGCTFRED